MYKENGKRNLFIKAVMIILIVIAWLTANATVKVAVIDSGLNDKDILVCGGWDFIANKAGVGSDAINHGTEVTKIINSYNTKNNACFYIYKVFSNSNGDGTNIIAAAINKAVEDKVDVINLSISSSDDFSVIEYMALYRASRAGIKIFLAAGNASHDLDKSLLFPVGYALIPMVIVGNKSASSNHGAIVKHFEDYCVKQFCGTSASVAIATGKYIGGL